MISGNKKPSAPSVSTSSSGGGGGGGVAVKRHGGVVGSVTGSNWGSLLEKIVIHFRGVQSDGTYLLGSLLRLLELQTRSGVLLWKAVFSSEDETQVELVSHLKRFRFELEHLGGYGGFLKVIRVYESYGTGGGMAEEIVGIFDIKRDQFESLFTVALSSWFDSRVSAFRDVISQLEHLTLYLNSSILGNNRS